MTEPLLRVKNLTKNFPIGGGLLRAAKARPCTRSTMSASTSARARRSGWSANPAPANRPPAAASCG